MTAAAAYEEELKLRNYGCGVLCEAGIVLGLPHVTVATAQTLLQRFYFVKSFKKHPVRETLAGALYLATKLEETHFQPRDVLNVLNYLFQGRHNAVWCRLVCVRVFQVLNAKCLSRACSARQTTSGATQHLWQRLRTSKGAALHH